MTEETPPAAQPPAPGRSERFPRSSEVPNQSPKYWAKEKDRYLRQLLIRDIETATGRPLVVYFSQLDQEIGHTDPDDLSEILAGVPERKADLFLQTPGGLVDATEKLISVLRHYLDDYRVIVPSWAKSAGTVIALSSRAIVLGVNSELGPIDPQWRTPSGQFPCELIAQDPQFPQHVREFAKLSVARMRALAQSVLKQGMLSGSPEAEITSLIDKISSSANYKSHGAVIDDEEAKQLGLQVEYIGHDESLWRQLWLLYCMYDYDAKEKKLGKIFEGSVWSIARPK